MRAVLRKGHAQRPGVGQHAQKKCAALGFGQRVIVWRDMGGAQQFGNHALVLIRALAQIERGQVKAKYLHRTHQR